MIRPGPLNDMTRAVPVFVFACMAIIAFSAGAVLVVQFARPVGEAVSLVLATFCTMAVGHMVFARSRERGAAAEAVDRLEMRLQEIDEDVGNLEGRLTGVEGTIPRRTREEIDPLFAEVEVLGSLVKQMAEAMADMEGRIDEQDRRVALPPQPDLARVAHFTEPPREIGYRNQVPPAAPQSDDARMPAEARAAAPVRQVRRPRSDPGMRQTIIDALDANRVDLYLQPIVTLPQRRVRFYEALSRLRDAEDTVIEPAEFLEEAARSRLLPRIDNLILFRAIQILRRLSTRNREAGLFVNISSSTLVDETFFPGFLEFVRGHHGFADQLTFEFAQADVAEMGVLEMESLAALADLGFRFSVDRVTDLKMDFRQLADRGFRFAKLHAPRILGADGSLKGDIHPADLGDLLQRYGMELIVDHVESETQVLDILDLEVRLAQGYLFSPPRPVRPEVLQGNPPRAARRAAE